MTDPRREIRQLRELVYRQQQELNAVLSRRLAQPKTRAPLLAQEFRYTSRWSGTLGKLTETEWQQYTQTIWPPPRIAECSGGVITTNFNCQVLVTVDVNITYVSGSSGGYVVRHDFIGPLAAPYEQTRSLMMKNDNNGYANPFIGQNFLTMRCTLPEGNAGYAFTNARPGMVLWPTGDYSLWDYSLRLILEVP